MSTRWKRVTSKSRLRWWIASQMNRLSGQCWSDLVTWALDWPHENRLPWRPVTSTCRRDAEECGTCFCGKLRAESLPAVTQEVPR